MTILIPAQNFKQLEESVCALSGEVIANKSGNDGIKITNIWEQYARSTLDLFPGSRNPVAFFVMFLGAGVHSPVTRLV